MEYAHWKDDITGKHCNTSKIVTGEEEIPKRKTIAPAITRVHKLFRLRTVVNEIPKYISKKKAGATSKDIGEILVRRKLSKTSILETTDKLKRARDHANNASILGLLVPIPLPHKHEFVYRRSIFGDMLSQYRFEEECPKDLRESAIFTDRIMRLKLTNPYDSRGTYSKFHSRPFLNILTVLRYQNLHIAQVHHLLSLTCDVSSDKELVKKTLDSFSAYAEYDENAIAQFVKDFKLTPKKVQREIGRSTKPLLDWAEQLDLLGVKENNWYFIKERGLAAQKFYSTLYPIWFDELGFDPAFASALLLVYMFASIKDFKINLEKLPSKAREVLESLNKQFDLLDLSSKRLKRLIDFDLNYDIPIEWRDTVIGHVKKLNVPNVNVNDVSLWPISQIEDRLSKTKAEIAHGELGKALGISIPRRECFQTDLEWQTCIKLRLLQLPASPYQGEFEGETDLPMATDNPDVVIKNSIKSLVECKSANEWGNVIILNKRIGGELYMYQSYAEEVNANSAVFVCDSERFDQTRFLPSFVKSANRLNKIVLVTWSFLDRSQKDQKFLDMFLSTIKTPESFKPEERILQ